MAEQIKQTEDAIKRLEAVRDRRAPTARADIERDLDRERVKLDELTGAYQRFGVEAESARQRQFSFAQAQGVHGQIPEIAQLEKLRNEHDLLVKTLIEVQTTGGITSPVLERMGVTYDRLSEAVARSQSGLKDFKTQFDLNLISLKIANDAVTAFSPWQRADIASRQSKEQTRGARMTEVEKDLIAERAYQNTLKQSLTTIQESARERELSAAQSAQSALLELSIMGETIGRQAELRANLQAEQHIYSEAARNRTLVNGKLNSEDQARLDRLKAINAELGRSKQLEAEKALGRDIAFDRSQIGLSDTDQAINSRLRAIYNDNLDSAQAEFYRQQLRVNEALRSASELGRDAFTGALQALRDGKFEMSELTSILDRVASKLIDMAGQNLWQSAFGGSSGGGGPLSSLASVFGFDGSSSGSGSAPTMVTGGMGSSFPVPTFGAANGGTFGAGWGVVGERGAELINVHSGGVTVYSNENSRRVLNNLPGFANGGSLDLLGRVFPPAPMALNNNDGGGSPPVVFQDNRQFHVGPGTDPAMIAELKSMIQQSDKPNYARTVEIFRDARKRGLI